jgi:hypothetical protein
MKRTYYFLLLLSFSIATISGQAQNVGINEDGSAPNPNAILDVKSFTKGILIPRLSTSGRLAIPNTKGLLVYDTTASAFFFNTGTAWQSLKIAGQDSASGLAWSLNGNTGILGTNFIGTTDHRSLTVKVENKAAGWIDVVKTNTLWGYNVGSPAIFDSTHVQAYDNTGIGYQSLHSVTDGALNTAVGASALLTDGIGSYNVAVGASALRMNDSGYYNVGIGTDALLSNKTGASNVGVGYDALGSNTTGTGNTAVGFSAITSNTSGSFNTGLGNYTLVTCTGSSNTAVGNNSQYFTSTGSGNTSVGQESLRGNNAGFYNTSIGFQSMFASRGSYNAAFGPFSLYNNGAGTFNAALGYAAMYNCSGTSYNTAVGNYSMYYNTSGSENTALGYFSLWGNTTGNYNTALGYNTSMNDGLTNATAIGANAVVNASNKVRIGSSSVTVIEGQVPFTTPSDGRYKYEVKEDVKGLDFILQLRPVTYRFDVRRFDDQLRSHVPKTARTAGAMPGKAPADAPTTEADKAAQAAYDEASAIRRTGFIAQEVEKAAIASGYDFSGIIKPKTDQDHYSLSYESFVVPLVKAVQEQQKLILDLQKQVEELKRQGQHGK